MSRAGRSTRPLPRSRTNAQRNDSYRHKSRGSWRIHKRRLHAKHESPGRYGGNNQFIKDAVGREALVNVFPTGCITVGSDGERLSPTGSLRDAGVVAISDGGRCVQDNGLMRRAVEYAHMFGIPVIDHCQDYSLSADGVMNEGFMSTKLGLRGSPTEAEDIMVSRNVILSAKTGLVFIFSTLLLKTL